MISPHLQQELVQGELADLHLYIALQKKTSGAISKTLEGFVDVETRHANFWKQAFQLKETNLRWPGKLRNGLILLAVSLGGDRIVSLMLEAVETHGIKKYLSLWKQAKDTPLQTGLRQILTEELVHEDEAATGGERTLNPDTIRNAFLGFNDGSVEILGAVSGLAAALQEPSLVVISGLTVSIAGSLSMAAGAFLSTHSEAELRKTEFQKQLFLNPKTKPPPSFPSPWKAARIVGISYLIGAAVPVLPFLLGASGPAWSIILSGSLILIVSALLAFLSGMNIRRRILLNAGVIIAAVIISYAFGKTVETLVGSSSIS